MWLGSWGYSRTTSHGAPIMPQCRLTVLSLTWCRTTSRLALATPQADFGASCATSAAGSAEQDVLAVAGSLLTPHWRVRRSFQHLRALRFSSPHPTSIPPHAHAHARKTFLNGSRRPAVNLNYCIPNASFRVSSSPPESRYNSPPAASILSPGERRHPQIDSSHLSFVPRSEAGYRSGQVRLGQARPGQDKARECGTRQPWLEFIDYTPERRWRLLQTPV